MSSGSFPAIVDMVPWDDGITPYDESHFPCYLQLLDAAADGMPEEKMCREILQLEPSDTGLDILRSHLKRARWMTEQGYRQLLK